MWTPEWDFQAAYDVDEATRDEAFAAWRAEIDAARRIEAGVETLDREFHVERMGRPGVAAHVLLHLIHEYARHNGHADLLREGIDGVVGDDAGG